MPGYGKAGPLTVSPISTPRCVIPKSRPRCAPWTIAATACTRAIAAIARWAMRSTSRCSTRKEGRHAAAFRDPGPLDQHDLRDRVLPLAPGAASAHRPARQGRQHAVFAEPGCRRGLSVEAARRGTGRGDRAGADLGEPVRRRLRRGDGEAHDRGVWRAVPYLCPGDRPGAKSPQGVAGRHGDALFGRGDRTGPALL